MAELTTPNKLHFSVAPKWLILGLVVVIAAMLAFWRPWMTPTQTDRTVSVTGTASVKAEPDEFLFSPSWEFKNADKTAALAAVTAKSNLVVAGLKKLGVADKDIKNSSNGGYEALNYPTYNVGGDDTAYSLNLSVTVSTRAMAQKVQDFLLTTTPSG